MTPGLPETMNAVRLHDPGGIEGLSHDLIPTPVPGDAEVLVKVRAAALTRDELNWPTDRLPAIPSYELSGTVVRAIGASDLEPGTHVFGLTSFDRDGVAAEYAVVKASELVLKPAGLSHLHAAALPLPGLSAMQGLFEHGRLQENQRVLIHGGVGGVGGYAVQLARRHGAYVIATVSTDRVEMARDLGADEVIDHTRSDFTTIGEVDLVFDTAGGDRLTRSVSVVPAGGRLVSVAERPPPDQCEAAGVEGIFFIVESNPAQLALLGSLAEQGEIQVMIQRSYPLANAVEAFTHIMERGGTGKVVLTIGDSERHH